MKVLHCFIFFTCCILNLFAYRDRDYDYSWDWKSNYPDNSWNKRNYKPHPDHHEGPFKYNNYDDEFYDNNNHRNYDTDWGSYNYGYHHSNQRDKACVTPNGEKAKCVPLDDCPVLQGNSHHNNQRIRFFKESICGYFKYEPIVCCGSEYNFKKKEPTWSPPFFQMPPYNPYFETTLPPKTTEPDLYPWSTFPPVTSDFDSSSESTIPSRTNVQTEETRRDTETTLPSETRFIPRAHRNFNLLPTRESCGIEGLQDKLLGGTEAGLGEFPWMALLGYQLNGISTGYKCAGMLINDRYVLTAAHCVVGTTLPVGESLVRVRLGEHDLNSDMDCRMGENNLQECNFPPQDLLIEETIIHPGFNNRSMLNDIALLRLQQIPMQNDFVAPICLPTEGERSLPGNILTICGWGLTENETKSRIKLKASVPYIDDNQCKTIWSKARQITDEQFCAGGSDRVGACSGDSGGPIMSLIRGTINWYAEGIVSYGRLPCGTFPNVYIRISSYINWILDNIKQ